MESNYSLSDLRAITDSADGISGGSAWLIILFVLIFGGGFNGFNRNGELNQYATAASQQDILFGQKFSDLDNKIDRLGNGIADATYALNNSIMSGNASVTGAITNEGRAIQTQLTECCCSNQHNVDSLRFDMANYAASINSNIDNKFAAIEKSNLESRLAEQAQQISQLQLQAAVCGIPRVNPTAWGTYPYSVPSGCGCNCGNI